MSGELKLPSQGGTGAAAVIAAAAASSTNATSTATRVVVLKNMPITEEELANDEDYEEILEDTKDECSSFGMLKNIEIPRTGDGKGRIFLEYLTKDDAANAIRQLQGRTFDGKKVEATYFDEAKFAQRDYSVTC
jgi:RNA recognition motif-containing protein